MVSERAPSATPTLIACGCTKSPHTLSWSNSLNTIAFGSANNVCVLQPESTSSPAAIVSTTAAHSKPVTCVKFARNTSAPLLGRTGDVLVSSSADGTAAAWQVCSSRLKSIRAARPFHKGSATFCCAAMSVVDGSNRVVAATMGADSLLVIWRFVADQNPDSDLIQTINMGTAFALCADFCFVQSVQRLLLCVGTSNSTIELFVEDADRTSIVKALTLTGHTDWVRAVSFKRPVLESDDWLLASAGQDNVIRLWRLSEIGTADSPPSTIADLPLDRDIRLKSKMIAISNSDKSISVTMEAVLNGHDNWVYSVDWEPTGTMRLLTASMDKCLVVWEPDADSGVWLESVRVGDVGGQAVGYFGGAFDATGDRIVGHSYFGGLHSWTRQKTDIGEEWLPQPTVGGHFAAVTDGAWDPTGTYFLSCSADQTTRIFSPYKSSRGLGYVELGRPQVHGHDLNCIASVSSNCFVSGAEEKIFRAFNAPRTFASSLAAISGINVDTIFADWSTWAEGASLPSLGLSNKALGENEARPKIAGDLESAGIQPDVRPTHLLVPPTEDHLMQNTLWPEVHKLYGHGYEVFAVAANHAGSVIATACKASKTEHATVMFWDTREWQRRAEVEAHSLTVTQLAFSPDDSVLLSVSRDRTWALYMQGCDDNLKWTKVAQSDKRTGIHTRIIWSCAWSPDSRYFATASRDKKLIFWRTDRQNATVTVTAIGAPYVGAESITAVDFAPSMVDSNYIVACGLENGRIEVISWNESLGARVLVQLDQCAAHSATIRRLRFRPIKGCWPADMAKQDDDIFELASVSDDHCVKVHRICLA
uniref:Elongator complex protein 2 n=1 Tax=Plectus sambesii TaxID=2011161 RepID=A0A914VYB1_9BILA